MKRLNILISAFACLPDAGSEPQGGWNWAMTLAERGHSVWILTRKTNQKRIERFLDGQLPAGITFLYVETPLRTLFKNEIGGAYYAAWQLSALIRARRLLRSVPIDIIHHVSYGAIQLPSFLCMLGKPTVFGPCGGGQTTPKRMLPLLGAGRRSEQLRSAAISLLPFSPVHRFLLRRTALVLATNQATLGMARQIGCSRVEPMLDSGLPEGYCVSSPKSADSFGQTVRLLWVGKDIPRKALPLALRAVSLVKGQVHLDIIGPSDVASVARQARQAGLADRVTVHGVVPWSELNAVFEKADCLLFSSLRDSFGSQLLEAAGNALAIICLDHQGAAEFVTDQMGFRVAPTTPEETAHALAASIDRYACLTPTERGEMSGASLQHARRFEWKKRIVTAEGFYEQLRPSQGRKSQHATSLTSEA